jgi:hypothetical protein
MKKNTSTEFALPNPDRGEMSKKCANKTLMASAQRK